MKQNVFASVSLMAVFCLSSAAFAQTSIADDVVAELQADGYTVTEVRKSWLGRIVITASGDDGEREVVLNRTSGEVLRDQTFTTSRKTGNDPAAAPKPKGGKPGPKGSGGPEGGGGHGGNG